jgi:hypothetical protein
MKRAFLTDITVRFSSCGESRMNYSHLWGNESKAVERARKMSRRNQRVKLEKCVEDG